MKVIYFSDLATIKSNEAFSTFAFHTVSIVIVLLGSRKVASWFAPNFRDFLNEFIALSAYCASFSSQDVMLAQFGYTGLFFAILCHMYISHSLNEGHGENVVILMDEDFQNTENGRYSTYLLSLIVPAHTATLIVYYLLLNLFNMIPTQPFCENGVLEQFYVIVIFCAFVCGAVLHAVLRRLHREDKYHAVGSALIYATLFTFSHAVIGIYAGHPFITLSRLLGCINPININSWPIPFFIHMISPLIGWILWSFIDKTLSKCKSIWQVRYDNALEDGANERIDEQLERRNNRDNLVPRNNRGGGGNSGRGNRRRGNRRR